jgi:hypothetical protein
MKPFIFIPAWVALIVFGACEKNNRPEHNTIDGLSNLMKSTTWRITRFVKGNTDKTSQFNAFRFHFRDELLMASSNSQTYMGSWSVSDHNIKNNETFADLDVTISFASPLYFNDLSRDWDVRDKTTDMLSLIDVRWDDGGVDYLVLGRE